MLHFRFGPPAVHGNSDCAHRKTGPERDNPAVGIRATDGDTVTMADSMFTLEPRSNRRDVGFKPSERDSAAIAEDHGFAIAKLK
ncbi:unannotated protein [freshwater metagenome]|uniref:Unannotated protein n=1 Tax=freshwater metagenome TaxID=449393 RepID=A0A6J7LAD5_9ZZZZ